VGEFGACSRNAPITRAPAKLSGAGQIRGMGHALAEGEKDLTAELTAVFESLGHSPKAAAVAAAGRK